MSDIRIEVFDGDYSNDDVYERVLGYIAQKECVSGYGFTCNPDLSIIEQFKLSELCSLHKNPQKIWHFCITFACQQDFNWLLPMAVWVAKYFSPGYQVLYGLDMERGGHSYSPTGKYHYPSKSSKGNAPHLHFGVNAFSYHPAASVLTPEIMKDCLKHIQDKLSAMYPNMTVTLQFQGKKG